MQTRTKVRINDLHGLDVQTSNGVSHALPRGRESVKMDSNEHPIGLTGETRVTSTLECRWISILTCASKTWTRATGGNNFTTEQHDSNWVKSSRVLQLTKHRSVPEDIDKPAHPWVDWRYKWNFPGRDYSCKSVFAERIVDPWIVVDRHRYN